MKKSKAPSISNKEAEEIQKQINFYRKYPIYLKMELEEAPKEDLIRFYKGTEEYKQKLLKRKKKLLKRAKKKK